MKLFLKIIHGVANSVDPDQTASSGSALFAYAILSATLAYKILGHVLYSLEASCQGAFNKYPQQYHIMKK